MRIMIPANVLALAEINAALPRRIKRNTNPTIDVENVKVIHKYSDGIK